MARTQAVHYRDKHCAEPVNEFIEALPAKAGGKDRRLRGGVPQRQAAGGSAAPSSRSPHRSMASCASYGCASPTLDTECSTNARTTSSSYCMGSRRRPVRSTSRIRISRSAGWPTSGVGWMRGRGCRHELPVEMRRLTLDAVEASSGGERRALGYLGEVLVEEHPGDELLARSDADLVVEALGVVLDRVRREDQRLGDLGRATARVRGAWRPHARGRWRRTPPGGRSPSGPRWRARSRSPRGRRTPSPGGTRGASPSRHRPAP